jgi:Tfp pilus assembly protein PilO
MAEDIEVKNNADAKSRTARLNEYLQSSQNKSYFVGAISIIFIGIFVVVGIVPSVRSVLSQNEENKTIETQLQKLNNKSNVLNALIRENTDNTNILGVFNSIFPDQNSQEDVITDIYQIAENNNVFIKTANFPSGRREVPLSREFRTKNQVQSQKVNLSLEGGRLELQTFISQIENSKRIYNVESIVITKKSGQALQNAGPGRDYDLSMVIEYFYWNEEVRN